MRGLKLLFAMFGFLLIMGSVSAVSNLTAADNLAYYKLEAATTPYLDSTPTGADLDQATIIPTQTGGIIAFGQNFNTNQRISTNTGIGIGTSGSVNVWINTASEGMSSNMFFDATDGADRTFMYWYGNANAYNFRIDGVSVFGNTMGPQGTGTWMMITMTWTNTDQTLYKDGVQIATDTQTPASSAFTTTYVGCHNNGNDCWNGDIDELSIWDVELTSAQVSELYNGGSPGSNQQYPFGGGGGGTNSSSGTNSQTGLPTNFVGNLTYDNNTRQWIYNWNDLQSTMNSTELQVWYYSNNTYSMFGSNTSISNPGSLYLDVLAIENNTMRGFAYLTDYNRTFVGGGHTALVLTAWNYAQAVINSGIYTIAEPEGVFHAMLIVGTMGVMSFFNPPVAIMTMVGGLFITSALGLFEISGGILMLLGLMGGILIWRLRA
jgi:hypothetical protein